MQTVQVVALPNPTPNKEIDDETISVVSTEIPNAIPMAPAQPPMVMTGEDEDYMYGISGMIEYSIEKATGSVYTKNPETGEWLYMTTPVASLPATHHNEHMLQTLHAMNYILNQNNVRMDMEIRRLHTQEIQPLRMALDQALATIKKMGNRKGTNPEIIQNIKGLETKNRELSESIMRLQTENTTIQDSNGKKIVEALAEQFKKFEIEMKSKEEEIESYKTRIQSLNRSMDEKEKNYQSKIVEIQRLQNEFDVKNQKILEMENEMKTFTTKENEWKSIRTELQTEIRDMKKRIKEFEFSYIRQEEIQPLNERIRELESENSRIKSSSSKKMEESIQEKVQPLQNEIRTLRTQMGNKEAEMKRLRSTYDKLVKTHEELVEQNQLVESSHKREIQELRVDVREATGKFDHLQERFSTVDKAYSSAREFCKKLSKEKNEMDAGYQNAMRDISKDLEKMTFECESVKEKNRELEKLFQECMTRFKASHTRNKELEEELKAFQMSVDRS